MNKFQILDPGHDYLLPVLDGEEPVRLTFVKRNNPPEKFPGNTNAYPGTTTQNVLRALIDRTKYVDNQIPHPANGDALMYMRRIIYKLESRAAERHSRELILTLQEINSIEYLPTCPVCGHIKPEKHSECKFFVFGSNLQGRHGKGAALHAVKHYGAVYGQAEGLQGNSYAIPTKMTPYLSLSLEQIAVHVQKFIEFAKANPDKQFEVTRIGCGLAGYTDAQIAPMFQEAPDNCVLPEGWREQPGNI